MEKEVKKERVIVYVDGFNLYFGMLEEGNFDCKWLNIMSLALNLLKDGQELVEVVFFTSYIANNLGKEKRQRTYLDALISKGVKIVKGKYERKEVECENCTNVWYRTNEKMTDVNIAVSLIMDAVNEKYDVAILISGDSDLVPAIQVIKNNFNPKKIIIAFPPARQNLSVKNAAHGWLQLGRAILLKCQLENDVVDAKGFILKKPVRWI